MWKSSGFLHLIRIFLLFTNISNGIVFSGIPRVVKMCILHGVVYHGLSEMSAAHTFLLWIEEKENKEAQSIKQQYVFFFHRWPSVCSSFLLLHSSTFSGQKNHHRHA